MVHVRAGEGAGMQNEITKDRNRRTQSRMYWWFLEAVHWARSSHPDLILTLHRVSSEDRNVGTLQLSPGHMPN